MVSLALKSPREWPIKMSQHVATWWPNARNMLRSTMLCWNVAVVWAGLNRTREFSVVRIERVVLKRTIVGDWIFDNQRAEFIFKAKQSVCVSRWRYKSGPLDLVRNLNSHGIGCNTRIKFVDSHWSFPVNFNPSTTGCRDVNHQQLEQVFLKLPGHWLTHWLPELFAHNVFFWTFWRFWAWIWAKLAPIY